MPIEVRELVIRASIGKQEEKRSDAASTGSDAVTEAKLRELVDQMIEITRRNKER